MDQRRLHFIFELVAKNLRPKNPISPAKSVREKWGFLTFTRHKTEGGRGHQEKALYFHYTGSTLEWSQILSWGAAN